MAHKEHSWKILDGRIARKQTDLSVFKHRSSEIPIDIRDYFGIGSFVAGDKKPIIIQFKGTDYSGYLQRVRSDSEVTRMSWSGDLSKEFNKLFPNVLQTFEYPFLYFMKISNDKYLVEFMDSDELEVQKQHIKQQERLINDAAFDLENEVIMITKEGKKVQYYVTRYERDHKKREEAIQFHGTKCMACGFDFEKVYGERGRNYIEVHHIVPLSSLDEEMEVNPKTDLICVCSNCHRMIHRSSDTVLNLEELKQLLKK